MRSLSCVRVGGLRGRNPATLSSADQLLIEAHLEGCGGCRSAADADEIVGALAAYERPVGPAARERAIRSAIDSARTESAPDSIVPARSIPRWAIAGAGLVAAAVIAVVVMRGGATDETAPITDRVVAGHIAVAGAAVAPDGAMPAGVEITSDDGATLALAHATVALGPGTAMIWRPGDSTVELLNGVLDVDVDPAAKRAFRIATARFAVEVLGTRFRVDREGVRVERGVVRVVGSDGTVVAERVVAGEAWTIDLAAGPEVLRATAAVDEIIADELELEPDVIAHEAARSVAELISTGRSRLAARDVAGARRVIRAALAAGPSRAQAAEARTLLAECALVAGNTSDAVKLYLEVSERYAGSTAGGTALFAAARLEANSGRTSQARTLFHSYLDRYPKGQLRREARDRLDILERQR